MTLEQSLSSPEFATIDEIGKRYRNGDLDPVEVTHLVLSRIERHDAQINSFITVSSEAALDAARVARSELESGVDRGPLHGIPVGLKDNIDTSGMRTTAGSGVWFDRVPDSDAAVVVRLRRAGAVIVGKTNMQEFAHGVPHDDFGQTRNPWDPARTAGGSSGGSAAAVMAGFCFGAVGTDTGGSVRVPASYCGAVGLKPTYGLVSTQGVFPLSWSLDHVGPLARTSRDAAHMLQAMTGRADELREVTVVGLRCGYIAPHAEGPELQEDVARSFEEACGILRAHGATVVAVDVPDLQLGEIGLTGIVGPEAAVAHSRMLEARPDGYAPVTRSQIEAGFGVPATLYVRLQQLRTHLAAGFSAALAGVDVLLSPTVAWSAPTEDPSILSDDGLFEGRRSVPYNMVGFPAMSIRSGFDRMGLPIGLQIGGRPGDDDLVLGVGAALERILPHRGVHPMLAGA